MKWYVVHRTVDGRFRLGEAFATREKAAQFLVQAVEELRSSHRRAEFDDEALILDTSHSGDDDVLSFIVSEEELEQYPLYT